MSAPLNIISTLADWDGKSDVILVIDNGDDTVSAKVCPADVMHRIMGRYKDFLDNHQLVFDSEIEGDTVFVLARWE
jgi:hypothetical protein